MRGLEALGVHDYEPYLLCDGTGVTATLAGKGLPTTTFSLSPKLLHYRDNWPIPAMARRVVAAEAGA